MTKRVAYIDGLRGIAALSVLVYHLTAWWGLPEYVKGPARFAIAGQHGVDLFFVLSGFCLSWPILQKIQNTACAELRPADFFSRRLVRILPPYYATIAVLLFVNIMNGKHGMFMDIVRQMLFFDKNVHYLESPFWTLGIEFRWYFLFPFLLFFWLRAPRAYLLGIGAVIAACECTVAASADLYALPAFALGIVAADLENRTTFFHRRSLLIFSCLLVGCFLLSGDFDIIWTFAMFTLVVTTGYTPWMRYLLSMPLITSIGVISYSLYLLNLPVIAFVYPYLLPRLGGGGANVASSLASLLAAGMFFFIVERPFLTSWKTFFVPKISQFRNRIG